MHHWSRRLLNSSDFAIWSGWVIRWWNLINLVCELSWFFFFEKPPKSNDALETSIKRWFEVLFAKENSWKIFGSREKTGKKLWVFGEIFGCSQQLLGLKSNLWVLGAIVGCLGFFGCSRQFFIFFTQNRSFLAQNILTYPSWLENQVI